MRRALKERYEFINHTGDVLKFDNGRTAVVLSDEGTGMPPIEYVTQRGPFQHGETVRDFFLRPRVVQLLVRRQFCGRSELWAGRHDLIDILKPVHHEGNYGAIGILRKYLPNGSKRDLSVRIESGPQFVQRQQGQWDEFAYQEALRFVAHNPIYFDPNRQTQLLTATTTQLVFPITFPISFESFFVSTSITYAGSWLEYPIFEVTGPLNGVIIRNETTDETLQLGYDIPAGVTVTFDLSFGVKTITDSSGNNLIPYLSSDSDLTTFHLDSHPDVAGGVNQISVSGSGESGATIVAMHWYNRYIGL